MSTQTSSISEDLLPRRYQEEVFSKAQRGNIIAALNTGSGKTLISLLLIKWISTQQTSKGKVIVFLVPKVTLVEQQGNYLREKTPLRVIQLHGALDLDLTDRQGWRNRFVQHDVFVMTAQIFINLLTHSLWSIDRVSLMVFDECHHARKNHPYNGIMREYFQLKSHQRPKVFGMTASPIWSLKDAVGSLSTLEANLDSKVVGVRENVDELTKHSPKPIEIIKEYPHPPEEYDYPSPSLWRCLCVFEHALWTELGIPWQNIEVRYFATLNNLGLYPASLFLFVEFQQYVSAVLAGYKERICSVNDVTDSDMEGGLPFQMSSKSLPAAFWTVRDILVDFESFFADESITNDLPIPVRLEWCTPKIGVLVDTLLAHHSPTFQGIVFVEQRQVAAVLAKILPAIPQLKGIIRSSSLVGQGVGLEGVSKAAGSNQSDAVKQFRAGRINLLIATSVAEEGLDFPACDLVVRFDPLLHMVGYVQSRGRARNKASTFVIMIQKDDLTHLSRYQSLKEGEPEMNRAYQSRQILHDSNEQKGVDGEHDDEEEINPVDLLERKRYVVPSTGAILNYDNSISLLQHLCDLIPRDAFTPPHIPQFTGDFQSTLYLPSSLPLSPDNRTFTGPIRRSKKEARRAVAFIAVKHLHQLSVFDNYLLPATNSSGKITEDPDGRAVSDISRVPSMMNVTVNDPWTIRPKLWVHTIYIDLRPVAGLVTGTVLPHTTLLCGASWVRLESGKLMSFSNDEDEGKKLEVMREFTKLGIWYRITSRPLTSSPSLFLVPLTADHQPDFEVMGRLIENPRGIDDWSTIGERDYDRVMIMNRNEFGRPYVLRRIRFDLTPISIPIPGTREASFPTYHDYFTMKWTRKKWTAKVPCDGPLMEIILLARSSDGTYSLDPPADGSNLLLTAPIGMLVPRDCCRWIPMSHDIYHAYEILPALCHRVTDMYRVQRAKCELGLPPIIDDRLVEAFTLPSASAGYNNQRLETLGDAVLQLCTTVHLFNKYPHRHEGQLTILRQQAVSNRYLLARAKEIELERFLISETQSVYTWRYVEPIERCWEPLASRKAFRCFPRRSLQDCMEATLGASFVTGGIQMALHTGEALGLAFGGRIPWSMRYSREPEASAASMLFTGLEDALGYTFHRSELLVEAVTHPSFVQTCSGSSYQRLEFLGDALLDLVVIRYLYDKFPGATSHQLALPRTKAICAPALASLAVRRLDLHKVTLINCVDLADEIEKYVPLLQATSGEEIIKRGWRYDPPKVLSDVFESVMGAILVDSGYNYERASTIVENVMQDVLVALSPSVSRDPVSELTEWAAGLGCTKVTFVKQGRLHCGIQVDGMTVLLHGTVVAGPVVASSLSVAKFLASERALTILSDVTSDRALSRLCTCGQAMEVGTTDISIVLGDMPFTAKEANLDDLSESEDLMEVAAILTRIDLAEGME